MTDEEINYKLRYYINKNIHYYNEYEQAYLKKINIEYIKGYKREIPDIVRQILEEIGYYDDKKDQSSYEAFINIMNNQFGIEKNIVEVGCGAVPTLAHKISLKQNSGTITLYDPVVGNYYDSSDRFVLKKEKFKRRTNVDNADLIFGFMPCEATQEIIECATDNNKDFIIALCEGGPHGDEFDYFDSTDDWLHAMMYLAERGIEENNMGKLKVLSFKKYMSDYPIIYNERSK